MLPVPSASLALSVDHPALHWVKADLHIHTSEDPMDEIDYSALELVERAAALGFRVLAITLHDKVFDDPTVFARAEELGVRLISAAELRVEGADVVILNLTHEEAAEIRTFEDLRALRAARGETLLTFAPHPFYRVGGSIGGRIEQCLDCFDAIEHCHFHVPFFNPNKRAAELARRSGKPLLATSDTHRWKFFGENYSKLGMESSDDALPSVSSVFSAIRAHRIQPITPTGGWPRFVALLIFLFVVHPVLTWLPGSKRVQARRSGKMSTANKNYPTDEQVTA